ncbi:putative RNA recognition motif containing protein [Lyophyllum shimeji]|uniref:RNA recognition motif containing protein n=1 Tax=Lyophyllum shimeji TaxID=47721 RepID=A0A9P3PGQ6_LYOSH|nr:putative RNA recognition motif containing protein [Lyophyllum shimeji]
MNRHHPYGGSFEHPNPRRGGSPSGPGPDRSHRYTDRGGPHTRGRGFGRGRGGYGSFDGNMSQQDPYDQGRSQGDMGPYSTYEAQASAQSSYYQNYGVPPAAPYAPPHAAAYNQDYTKIEDGPGPSFDENGYGRGGGVRRPIRQQRDDKVHDSIIEERIQRERPCRTLFIRNIKYETNSDDVRAQFEEHGEIKTFFDLISTRGMVFVTYYDLRAAERARERLQGSEISGRPIDVHYSLPRDDHAKGLDRDKNQQLQGTLQVTLRNSASGAPLDDNEVRRKFQQFGDVKSVSPVGDRPDSRYVEFYDTRAAEEAFDRLRHQAKLRKVNLVSVATGLRAASMADEVDVVAVVEVGEDEDAVTTTATTDASAEAATTDVLAAAADKEEVGGMTMIMAAVEDEEVTPTAGGYGPPGGAYGAPPPAPPAAPAQPDDRLEQARKVQQLLAALKQPAGGAAPPPAGPPAPGVPPTGMPGMPPVPPPGNYYSQPPNPAMPPYPGAAPPAPPYGNVPPQSSTPQPGAALPAAPGAAPSLGSLPPNILALLQSAQQQRPPQPGAPPGPPGAPQYGAPPTANGLLPPPPPAGSHPAANAQYQQLMSFLQAQAGAAGKQ